MPCLLALCPDQSNGIKTASRIGSALAAIGRALGKLFNRRVTEADRWLALDAEWHALGDNTLRDIGLSRTEIPFIEKPQNHAPDRST